MRRFLPHFGASRYIFTDPDTGREYTAPNFRKLIQQIHNYREQNQLEPIPYIETVVENYICSLPENAGKCDNIKLKRGILSYLKGGIALLENIFYGEENMVSPEVAEKRALICIKCPYNSFPDKGAFIAWADEVAEASTGGKKTSNYDKLGNCIVCSCPLRAKVWYKGTIKLTPEQEKQMSEVGCWQVIKE